MLTSFTIRNFRCFKDFTISPLERINLITGMNNVGKTALLEGLFLFAGATNPQLAMNVNVFRGITAIEIKPGLQSETPWNTLFHDLDEDSVIVLSGENGEMGKRTLKIKVVRKESELVIKPTQERSKEGYLLTETTGRSLELEYVDQNNKAIKSKMTIEASGMIRADMPPLPIPYQAIFLASRPQSNPAEDAQRYSNLEIAGQQAVLLEILKIIEPKLRRLAVAVTAGIPMIYGDISLNRLLPLAIMGDGITRVCSLVLAIANSKNGMVFIDEIENGIHYSIMDKIWAGVAEAARQFNVQIFATTHSRECIIAAHNAFSQSGEYDFLLHRLDKINGEIAVKTYDRETLGSAIETRLEVR